MQTFISFSSSFPRLAAVVKTTLEDSGAHNVVINKCILNAFKKKISLLHSAGKSEGKP